MDAGRLADRVHDTVMRESENEQSRNGQQPSDTKYGYVIPWLINILPLRSFFDCLPIYTRRKANYHIPFLTHELGWSVHAIIDNLLYYQTNYFVFFFAVFGYIGYIDPLVTIGGIIALSTVAVLILLCMDYLSLVPKSKNVVEFRGQSPEDLTSEQTVIAYSVMLGSLVFASVYIYLFLEFVISWLLFALFFIILHAAVRRRDASTELFETLGSKKVMKTPMATLLQDLGVIEFACNKQW